MADDTDDKQNKFDFTTDGEALGYISLAQARLLAMQTARETPGEYGGRFRDASMAIEIAESSEDEDYYIVTLGVRPQGDFTGDSGRQQFFISKDGELTHRQVLSLPRTGSRRRIVSIVAGATVSVVVIAAVLAFVIVSNGSGGTSSATPTPPPTSIIVVVTPQTGIPTQISAPKEPTPTPFPTLVPLSTYTPFPTATPRPTFTPFPASLALPTYTPLPTFTPFPTPTALPTYTPLPTSTPQPTYILFPTPTVMPTTTRILRRIITTTTPITRFTPKPISTATPAAFTPENIGYIPLLDAYVSEVKFFELPFELKPESQRVYADRFDQA